MWLLSELTYLIEWWIYLKKDGQPARGKKVLEYPTNPGIEKLESFCFAAFGLFTTKNNKICYIVKNNFKLKALLIAKYFFFK